MSQKKTRRELLKQLTAGSLAVTALPSMSSFVSNSENEYSLKGNINHSVCTWTYNFLPLDDMCSLVKKLGFTAIDLLAPKDWSTIQKQGITCSMCYTAGKISLTEGWNMIMEQAVF